MEVLAGLAQTITLPGTVQAAAMAGMAMEVETAVEMVMEEEAATDLWEE